MIPLVNGKLDLEVADRYWNKRPRNRAKMVDFNTARTTKMIAEAPAEMNADELQENGENNSFFNHGSVPSLKLKKIAITSDSAGSADGHQSDPNFAPLS